MQILEDELERRWRVLFGQLHEGLDVPPAQWLRTEGLMEALALLESGCESRLQAAMAAVFHEVTGRSLEQDFEADWCEY
ncbi:MAG: hypothetical protein ACK5HY_05180, partial [Parahaliea sp.]